MRKILFLSFAAAVLIAFNANASLLDDLKEMVNTPVQTGPAGGKAELGLKEALNVGMKNTINYLGKKDGYFGNAAVKILLPEKIRKLEPALRGIGYGPQIDEFTLSMNRAAEKAAPLAADIFSTAISEMTFEDANKILRGGNTAATDYLKNKTYNKLLEKFQPQVRKTMGEYKVTQKFDALNAKAQKIPLVGQAVNMDVNHYVSSKALDGLFLMLAKEETDIRTNPKARVTDLLKEVFK
ncbi:MAG TPA: DUF4197 domain-containing protein [Smithella sp.]|nr:DUF4197 domain-containing protein [Smithella sp.]